MVWSKAFIMERERFDGADIAHLLRARGRSMRWRWLVRRFGPHWPVLLSHLILLRFVYPGEAAAPEWVTALLVRRLQRERRPSATAAPICMGTLLSRAQYLIDVQHWGYRDGRRPPSGRMREEDVRRWTAAIEAPA